MQKIRKMKANSFSGTEYIHSQNNEFVFVIYNTASKNRKSIAIYRKVDGERREVNLILNHEKQKNIGKKIANAIKELRTRPVNELFVKVIERSPKIALYHICMSPLAMLEDKDPKMSAQEYIYNEWIRTGYDFPENPVEQRVCNLCLNYKNCQKLYHVCFCIDCKNQPDFKTKLILRDSKWYKANGVYNNRSIFEGGDVVPYNVCAKCVNYFIDCKCHRKAEFESEDCFYSVDDGKCYNVNCNCQLPKSKNAYIGKTSYTLVRKVSSLIQDQTVLCISCKKNTKDVKTILDSNIDRNFKRIVRLCESCESKILQEITN
mgnify:FL=1